MKQQVLRNIPAPLKTLLKRIYYLPTDIADLFTKRDGMIPPRSMIFIGSGDFIKIGEGFKKHFIEQGNLQPHHRVLDVGCGIGRMAIPLTSYLSEQGEYWGFDIVRSGIDWCQKRITPRYGNFHFLHSDVYNKEYNPKGKIQARDFKFPFETGIFDFVFLTSVFTHMLPPDVENYISEIARVLKPGGKCMITFFLLNDESLALVRSGKSGVNFKYQLEGCMTTDDHMPEAAVAYREEDILQLYARNNLVLDQGIYYGYWCNRESYFTYQDMVVAEKSRNT